VNYAAPRPGAPAAAVPNSLVLAGSGSDIRATVVIERWPGPAPAVRHPHDVAGAEISAGPDASTEFEWELTGADPLLAHVVDYGAFPLDCQVGLVTGRWRVRVSCWHRTAAEVFSDEVFDAAAAADDEAGAADSATLEDLFPLGPEVWLLQLWPTSAG